MKKLFSLWIWALLFSVQLSAQTGTTVSNPDLTGDCPYDVAVIVDLSFSKIGGVSMIRDGLNEYIDNLVGSGNTVTFIGMGEDGVGAITSSTLTYDGIEDGEEHHDWVDLLNLTGSNDSWSSGFFAAASLNPDLVLVVTGENEPLNNIQDETDRNIISADALKNAGAHLFVFGAPSSSYIGGSLLASVTLFIDPSPTSNTNLDFDAIATNDFIQVSSNFSDLGPLISLSIVEQTVEITAISNRNCILGSFDVEGEFEICPGLTVTDAELEFYHDESLVLSVDITVNANGTFDVNLNSFDLVAAGLIRGQWYDVRAKLTLSNGVMLRSEDFVTGLDDDIFIANQADPQVILNTSEDDLTTSLTRFCEGSPIFYHGIDPLSGDQHYVSIQRRETGSTGPYGEFRKFGGPTGTGFVPANLDGFTDDILDYFPPNSEDYFMAGYEYELKVATYDIPGCVAWTETFVEFEIIDCCEAPFTLSDVPDCVEEGVPFTVTVTINAPLTAADIELVYSYNNNYEVLGYEVILDGDIMILEVTLVSNTCSCEGEVLIFDIRHSHCSEPIWVMTHDPIPCCAQDCGFINIVDWEADADCIIVNGDLAREFCIEVSSPFVNILGVIEASNGVTCQVELVNLEITAVTLDGNYLICGYLVFEDEDCTGHATVSLLLDTDRGCCRIDQPFSFPGGCVVDEACTWAGGEVSILDLTADPQVLNVALDLPLGSMVTVIDHITGNQFLLPVSLATCGPFAIDIYGNIFGGSPCNGLLIPVPDIDCESVEGERPVLPYHFELQFGDCIWVIAGDYCRTITKKKATPGGGIDGGTRRSQQVESLTASPELKVFPNPTNGSNTLTFHFSNTPSPVTKINLMDSYGRMVASIIPGENQQVYQHQLSSDLSNGLYFVVFQMQDGGQLSKKLLVLE